VLSDHLSLQFGACSRDPDLKRHALFKSLRLALTTRGKHLIGFERLYIDKGKDSIIFMISCCDCGIEPQRDENKTDCACAVDPYADADSPAMAAAIPF
jgi:hypothetical protein